MMQLSTWDWEPMASSHCMLGKCTQSFLMCLPACLVYYLALQIHFMGNTMSVPLNLFRVQVGHFRDISEYALVMTKTFMIGYERLGIILQFVAIHVLKWLLTHKLAHTTWNLQVAIKL